MSLNVKEEMMKELREKLSELEHNQWMYWTQELEKIHKTDEKWQYQLDHWRMSWIHYSELTEGQKEMDRIHADKVIDVMLEFLSGHTSQKNSM